MKRRNIIGFMLCIVLTLTFTGCDNSLSLSIRIQKGELYALHTNFNSIYEQVKEGNKTRYSYNLESTLNYAVTPPKKDKTMGLTMKYTQFKVENTDITTLKFDSEDQSKKYVFPKILRNVKGAEFTGILSEKGEIKQLNFYDTIQNTMLQKLDFSDCTGNAEWLVNGAKDQFDEFFGEKALNSHWSQVIGILPAMKVKPGSRWETSHQGVRSVYDVNIVSTYELLKIEGDIATLKVTSKLDSGGEKTIKKYDMDYVGSVTGNGSGNIEVNTKNGFLIKAEIEENNVIKQKLRYSEDEPFEVEPETKQKVNIKCTNTKVHEY